MKLPESIQQQAEYAEALGQKFAGVSNKEVAEQTQQTEEQPKAEEPKQEEAEASEMEKLRNRYSSLQGKYNAEVPRLNARNQELEGELRHLMEENKRLRDEAAKKEASAGYLTENDASEFGSDMVDLVRRGAKEELKPYSQVASRLMSEVEELKNQLRMTQQQAVASAQEKFYADLTRECPNWESQDKDPQFIAWLQERDPALGVIRQQALNDATNQLDGHRVAVIFNTYTTFLQQKKTTDNPLARQVSPSYNGAGHAESAPERKWTQAGIAAFYEGVRHGEYTPEQRKQIEQEIENAVATGQVLP